MELAMIAVMIVLFAVIAFVVVETIIAVRSGYTK